MKTVLILRGLPGMGKSTLAEMLKQLDYAGTIICSADHWFQDGNGNYNFRPEDIGEIQNPCGGK